MKRAVLAAVLIALTLIVLSPLVSAQDAKGKPKGAPPPVKPKGSQPNKSKGPPSKAAGKGGKFKPVGAYARLRGTPIPGGFCYRGPVHRPWTIRYWSPVWRLWLLYDPNTLEWYFWHPRLRTYLPVAYLRINPPPLAPATITPNQALKNVPVNVNNVPRTNNPGIPNMPVNPVNPVG